MAKKLNFCYCIKARNAMTGDEHILTFHNERDRDDALAILREYGLAAFINGVGNFERVE